MAVGRVLADTETLPLGEPLDDGEAVGVTDRLIVGDTDKEPLSVRTEDAVREVRSDPEGVGDDDAQRDAV